METPNGKTLRRNRRHIQVTSAATPNSNLVSNAKELTNELLDQGNLNETKKSPVRCSSRGRSYENQNNMSRNVRQVLIL